jgi:hypothetical protein
MHAPISQSERRSADAVHSVVASNTHGGPMSKVTAAKRPLSEGAGERSAATSG